MAVCRIESASAIFNLKTTLFRAFKASWLMFSLLLKWRINNFKNVLSIFLTSLGIRTRTVRKKAILPSQPELIHCLSSRTSETLTEWNSFTAPGNLKGSFWHPLNGCSGCRDYQPNSGLATASQWQCFRSLFDCLVWENPNYFTSSRDGDKIWKHL